MLNVEGTGFDAFAAADDFDVEAAQGNVAIAKVLVADPCDPSGVGVDPSGVSTTCFVPAGGLPTLCVRAPAQLVTSEEGTADFFEVYGQPDPFDPSGTHIYYVNSTAPNRAKPRVAAVVLGADACEPHPVWVSGQNDSFNDGDGEYGIEVASELGSVEATVPGINLDNDSLPNEPWPGAVIAVEGPASLALGGSAIFDVYVSNFGGGTIDNHDLLVEATPGLEIRSFAVTGGTFKGKAKLVNKGTLLVKKVELQFDETILLTIDVTLVERGPTDQELVARFVDNSTGEENDNSQTVRTSLR